MTPAPQGNDPAAAAALIADICAALQSAGRAEEKVRLAASGLVGGRVLDARLEQIQSALDRIDARLAEVEHDLAVLIRPSWPF